MSTYSLLHILVISLIAFAVPSVAGAQDKTVKLKATDTAVQVEIGGQAFTTYHFADGLGKPYVRPFFFPVMASDGAQVTADQATGGGDHAHHRSIWVAHGDVNGADHWSFGADSQAKASKLPSAGQMPKQRHIAFAKVEGDTIEEELEWEGKDHQPILKEHRALRFMACDDGARAIDFALVFTPISGPVTFGDTKEAGLCAVRLASSISKKPTITQSTGATGEKACWGKKAAWCDESGMIDGKAYGVAILDHPQNPRHPSNWHVRDYGLLAANIFGLHDYDKNTPKNAGDFTIEKDKPVTFRYRVIIHQGDAAAAKLDGKFAEFVKP